MKTPDLKNECAIHGLHERVDSFVIFSSDGEFVPNWYLMRCVRENEGNFEPFNRGKVFFKNLSIMEIVGFISQETDRLTEQNNGRHVRSRCKAKSNAESLDRTTALSWISLNNDG
jgi:hypothetical protein